VGRLDIVRAAVDSVLLGRQGTADLRCGLIHLYGVSTMCSLLAQRRGLDREICTVAGMLHDISTYETGEPTDHARLSAARARELLRQTRAYSDREVADICDAIALHSLKSQTDGQLAELLKDADVLQNQYINPTPIEISERTTRIQAVLRELGFPIP